MARVQPEMHVVLAVMMLVRVGFLFSVIMLVRRNIESARLPMKSGGAAGTQLQSRDLADGHESGLFGQIAKRLLHEELQFLPDPDHERGLFQASSIRRTEAVTMWLG